MGSEPAVGVQSAFAVSDFLANTFSAGMNMASKSAEGGAIRKALKENGYDVHLSVE